VNPKDLVDEEIRRRIAEDLGTRMAVDAGAGSGKTTALIERIVSLVSNARLSMGSIAAITFTEAAAAELRLRVRQTLAERAHSDPSLLAPAREVDDAAICTIHAFALRILSEHWLEAGLPPKIEVFDPASEYLDHKTRWELFTTGLLGDPAAMVTLTRAFAAELRLSQLSEIAHSMADHHDRLTPQVIATLAAERKATAEPTVEVATIVGHLERALAYLPQCTNDSDNLCHHLQNAAADALRRLRPLVDSKDEATVISVLGDIQRLSYATGQKGNWTVDIADVRAACAAAERARGETMDAVRASVVADLTWRMARWAVETAAARRDEGRFTFHDLLVESCRLVRENENVRAALRDRYRCLLIDEFQDTDPLQAELAHLLGRSDPLDEVARLFVVGDPEQSIYRFRRADIAQFDATVAQMEERLELTSNFRSVPEILQFVDAVFTRLSPSTTGALVVPHRSLNPVRPKGTAAHQGPPVSVLGAPHDEGRARDVRFQATAEVASTIRAIVDDSWTVNDVETAPRPAKYGDIAVLLPTRTALAMLERAFDDADIPYRLEGATLVWGSQDVRDLLAIARATDDPADPVAVVGALRTPALACGDDDLVRYNAAGGSWDPRSPVAEGVGRDDPVSRAMATLAALHECRMWMEPSALIEHILAELHFFELALVHRRPRDHWQRLRWVHDQVRAFDESRGGRLSDFLEWVDLTEEAERWSSSLGPPEPDDDAVRVMTIHGSKGLEFPIVLLTGLDSSPPNVAAPILFDEGGVPRFRLTVDFRSASHARLSSTEAALDKAERFRLLYVALTRARDHLILDLNHKGAANNAMAAILYPICEQITDGLDRLAPVIKREKNPPPPEFDDGGGPQTWWSGQDRWSTRRAHLLASVTKQPAWSATALSKAAGASKAAPNDIEPSRETRPGRNLAGGHPSDQQGVGRAVHDALAKIPLPPDGVLTNDAIIVAGNAARAHHLAESDTALVIGLVRSAVASPLVRSIAAGRHWKELPLAAPVPLAGDDRGVIEGFADLVGESADGLVVVDFKTTVGRSSSMQYLLQVALYAYALTAVTGQVVHRVVVAYLNAAGVDEMSLEGADLETAIARVLLVAHSQTSADVADSW
jgi:ATP-dependent exoDNAse (exonuclease V) beta subunit